MIKTTELREKLADAQTTANDLALAIRDAELAGKNNSNLASDLLRANAKVDALKAALAEASRIKEEDAKKLSREMRARSMAVADKVADELAEAARNLDAALIQVELAHESLELKKLELRQALAIAGLADAGHRLHNTTSAGLRWATWFHAPVLAKDLGIPNCPVARRRSLADTVTTAMPHIPTKEAA